MEIVPSQATLGASIYGVNLHRLDDRTGERIVEAWHEYGVLAFPGQHLDDAAHIAFSRRFGHLERLLTTAIEGTKPEIFRVANVRPDGAPRLRRRPLFCVKPGQPAVALRQLIQTDYLKGFSSASPHFALVGRRNPVRRYAVGIRRSRHRASKLAGRQAGRARLCLQPRESCRFNDRRRTSSPAACRAPDRPYS